MKPSQTTQFWDMKSAIGMVISCCLILLSMTVPFVGNIGTLLLPLVVFYYRSTLGRWSAAAIILASLILVVAATRNISLLLVGYFCLLWLGFLLGEGYSRNISMNRTLLAAWLSVCAIILAVLFGYSDYVKISVPQLITTYVAQMMTDIIAIYKEMGVAEDILFRISQRSPQIQAIIVQILPAFYASAVLFLAWGTLSVGKNMLAGKRYKLPSRYSRLSLWRIPEFWVWPLIGFGLIVWLATGTLQVIALNGLVILGVLYLLQGFSILVFWFQKWRIPTWLRVLLFILIGLQQILVVLVAIVGLIDVWLDFRKLRISALSQP